MVNKVVIHQVDVSIVSKIILDTTSCSSYNIITCFATTNRLLIIVLPVFVRGRIDEGALLAKPVKLLELAAFTLSRRKLFHYEEVFPVREIHLREIISLLQKIAKIIVIHKIHLIYCLPFVLYHPKTKLHHIVNIVFQLYI